MEFKKKKNELEKQRKEAEEAAKNMN